MTSSEARKPNYRRRFLWFAIFIAILFGGYSAGWYYFADRILSATTAAIAKINRDRDGVTAECASPTMHGYPFRIGIRCDSVSYVNLQRRTAFSAGSLRATGQVYDPTLVVAELDSPFRFDLADSQRLEFSWEAFRISFRGGRPKSYRLSIEGKALAVVAGGRSLGKADAFQAHMLPNGADIDFTGSFDGLAVDPSVATDRMLPNLSNQSDITLKDGIALLQNGQRSLRGVSGTIRTLEFSSGPDTGFGLSGTFAVDPDGLLDADLQLSIRDPKGLSAVLADAFPEQRNDIEAGFSGLISLGAQPSLPVIVRKGSARLGFVVLGEIPPLP